MKHVIHTGTHPVIRLTDKFEIFDLTAGYDPDKISAFIRNGGRAMGGYNEKRSGMYLAPHFGDVRNIHMGIDFWAPAGEPVFSAMNGTVAYTANRHENGNYGVTVVLRHEWKGEPLFALYGHLSLKSLEQSYPGKMVATGEIVGWLGNKSENGCWPPHLHYQLSVEDPGEADMPGVVSENDLETALNTYPDPGIVLGSV
jgi:peptidoglycan LD-endopeptidase LytH